MRQTITLELDKYALEYIINELAAKASSYESMWMDMSEKLNEAKQKIEAYERAMEKEADF